MVRLWARRITAVRERKETDWIGIGPYGGLGKENSSAGPMTQTSPIPRKANRKIMFAFIIRIYLPQKSQFPLALQTITRIRTEEGGR